jgi:hypothetical protein
MAAKAELMGLKECREALQEMNKRTQKGLGSIALRRAANIIFGAVEARAPVSSRPDNPTPGSLKASGFVGKNSARGQLASIAVIFSDPAAVPNEYGTTKMAAQPYFRPGVDASEAAAIAAFESALTEEVTAAAEKVASKSKSKGS